ncbi:MAG: hydrogenase formation protein HypD [Candidatus Omnitrophota bacterium]|nr:MAG: hydrogenase formation protein HypD [Candidatus Omnitrophota bacterium]
MRYIDEFRNKRLIKKIAEKIKSLAPMTTLNIMEVCGTHTQNFYRFGLDKLLPSNIKFISGPGCPVCVSPSNYIDSALQLAHNQNVIITTFGDMLRVPGRETSLEKIRSKTGNIRIVYSALDALIIAKQNPGKKVVFLAVGFETTAPTIAQTILLAEREKLKNLYFYSSLRLIPAAMEFLLKDKRLKISGFLCPGHVCAIIGTKPYEFIPKRYKIGCCVAGFEPLDILEGIYFLLRQIVGNKPRVQNQYSRIVTKGGNLRAQRIISRVFKIQDAYWRGLGKIRYSGLGIKREFSQFDAARHFSVSSQFSLSGRQRGVLSFQQKKCRCGEVLKGLITPDKCALFARGCHPDNPLGPCMVSSEGTCSAYYKYRR